MTFELIFGKSSLPGSSQVIQSLLAFKSREHVLDFCEGIRVNAAGGQESIKARLSKVKSLEYKGRELLETDCFEEAYKCFEEASEILGDFTLEQIEPAVRALLALKRFEEAIALTHHGQFRFSSDKEAVALIPLQGEAYFRLGYRGDAIKGVNIHCLDCGSVSTCTSNTQLGTRLLDEDDFQRTLRRIYQIDNQNWHEHLFLVTHSMCYLEKLGNTAHNWSKQRSDEFIQRIEANKTLMNLFRRADFATLSASELRFILWFITMAYGYCIFIDPENMSCEFAHQTWYRTLMSNLATSLVSPESIRRKIPVMDRKFFQWLVEHWVLTLAHSIFVELEDGENARIFAPFEDISWYYQLSALMIVFGEQSLVSKTGEDDVIFCLCKHLLLIMKHNKVNKRVLSMTSEKFRQVFDLSLFIEAVLFADWSLVLVKTADRSLMKVRPSTNFAVTTVFDDLASQLITVVMATLRETLIEHHLAWFIMNAQWAEFFSRTMVYLVDDAEKWVVGCFSTFMFSALMTDYKKLIPLANCDLFCEPYLKSISRSIAFMIDHEFNIITEGELTKGMMDSVGNFVICSKNALFSRIFFKSNEGANLCQFAFEQFFLPKSCVTPFCLAALLRGADETCRKKWLQSKEFRVIFRRLSTKLFHLIMEPERKCQDDETINFLLAFHALICIRPQLASFESALSLSQTQGQMREAFLLKLHRFLKHFVSENRGRIRKPGASFKMPNVLRKAGSVVAGMIIAQLTENEHFFRKRLLEDEKIRSTIVSDFQKLVF